MMRSPTLAFCGLLLPTIIFSQDHVTAPAHPAAAAVAPLAQKVILPGGASFEIRKDEMTDAKICVVFTATGLYAAVSGPRIVIWTPDQIGVDYTAPAFMRLGDDAPFQLTIPREPHRLHVPPSHR